MFLMAVVSLAAGCATSFPEVESDFEQNWQPREYQAEVYLIPSASEALARRIDMVRSAKVSIDMTYFSWDKDIVGLMLLEEVKIAAERGVKVRLVLDDLLVFDEKWLAEVSQHPNMEVRLFNPFDSRKAGWLGRVGDFVSHKQTLDHRLHEKYFNVDHEHMILGGRNIGSAYFGYSDSANFFDTDVLFHGEVIEAFAHNYDQLWGSEHLVAIADLIQPVKPEQTIEFEKAKHKEFMQRQDVLEAVDASIEALREVETLSVVVTPVFDSAKKINDSKPYFRARAEQLVQAPLEKAKTVTISTPYVIAHNGEFTFIDQLIENNIDVTLVTNSSSSNDSAFIPAYYEQYREQLLDKGVNIYEYKDNAVNEDNFYQGDTYYHNKTVIIDDKLTYIGSSNFDPRSDYLNMEFGVFIQSKTFAQQVKRHLLQKKDELYWQVSRDPEGKTQWVSGEQVETSSPNYGAVHKVPDWLFRKLNVELEL
jgi:putative cardiolipin synthase